MKPILEKTTFLIVFLQIIKNSTAILHRDLIEYPELPRDPFALSNESFNSTDCFSCLNDYSNSFYCSNADVTFQKK